MLLLFNIKSSLSPLQKRNYCNLPVISVKNPLKDDDDDDDGCGGGGGCVFLQDSTASDTSGGTNHKDKSILQMKLTKIVVQIGKFGSYRFTLFIMKVFNSS